MVFSLEGMMLMVPPRATEKVHFTPPLKLYIQTSYQEDANKYASDLQSFDALRDEINAASSPDAFMRCAARGLRRTRPLAVADPIRWTRDGAQTARMPPVTCSSCEPSPPSFHSTTRPYVPLPMGQSRSAPAHAVRELTSSGNALRGTATRVARNQVRVQFIWADAFQRSKKRMPNMRMPARAKSASVRG